MKHSVYTLLLFLSILSMCPMRMNSTVFHRTFRVINASSGLADNSAQTLLCTRSGMMVVSTIGYLNFYDGAKFTCLDNGVPYRLSHYTGHYHLYIDKDGYLWLKDKHQVICIDMRTGQYVRDLAQIFARQGVKGQIDDLFVDEDHNLWLLQGDSLYGYGATMTVRIPSDKVLQDVDIVGREVLLFFSDGHVKGYDTLTMRPTFDVPAYGPSDAELYKNTSVVYRYGHQVFQLKNGKKASVLMSFDVKQRRWTILKKLDYSMNNMAAHAGVLYIASAYGLWTYHLTTGHMEHYDEFRLNTGRVLLTDVNTLAFDKQGGLWLGTEKRGLMYAQPIESPFRILSWDDPSTLKIAAKMDADGLPHKIELRGHDFLARKNCSYVDSRGWLWVGALDGLRCFKPGEKKGRLFGKKDGMVNSVVHCIIEDDLHDIWVGTSNGIVGFMIRKDSVVFVNSHSHTDGLPVESFENGRATRLADGTIVMQGIDNLIAFNPNTMKTMYKMNLRLKPLFVRLSINGTNVNAGTVMDGEVVTDRIVSSLSSLNLDYNQNSVVLLFSSMNYFRPMQTYYRVKISGIQDEWRVVSFYSDSGMVDKYGRLHLQMNGLEPGSYKVEVQASMYPDKWENAPTTVTVNIREPWWQKTMLYSLIGLVIVVLIGMNIYYYRRNNRLRMKFHFEERELIKQLYYFVDRSMANEGNMQRPRFDEIYGNDTVLDGEISTELSNDFVNVMLDCMPYVQQRKLEHGVLEEVAKRNGLSITRLYDIVAANIHKNPRLFVRSLYLHNAAKMLRNTDSGIDKIATSCHFSSPNFFISCFLKRYGTTPAAYRKGDDGSLKVR